MEKDENNRYLGQVDKEGEYRFGVSGGIGHWERSGDPNIHCPLFSFACTTLRVMMN